LKPLLVLIYTTPIHSLDFAVKDSAEGLRKMAIFDMDKTIQQASFIHTIAAKFNFKRTG
jgi:hypothetical protein